ncbi:hypothetical protein Vadar_031070 [Vaccinium darrowii]|uniref:Uncharacterized protein n=1 Tax=Vaccinium darrowii TaxID=229202 RepID=A0ACB7X5F6_9ERIC|nr:hypothetical protein Vadar_031070 [Vaccinium darrowii]
MFKQNNLSFTKILEPYACRSLILNMPARFAKKYLHGVSDSIELEVSGGKRWKICCTPVKGLVRILSTGWGRFTKDNNLGKECTSRICKEVSAWGFRFYST